MRPGSATSRPPCARVSQACTSTFSARRVMCASARPIRDRPGSGSLRSRVTTTRRTSSGSIRTSRLRPRVELLVSRRRQAMAEKEPTTEQLYLTQDATPAPWAEARVRLADADPYWLATVRPEGLPHLVPILAVWVDGALHFVASPTSRKPRNIARDPHCVITARREPFDLVVEGTAAKVSDEARLRRVAEVYMTKYGWPVSVRDGAFYGEGAPTADPPRTKSTK